MAVNAVFTQMGLIVGECEEHMDGSVLMKNPVILSTRKEGIMLIPFLDVVEESSMDIRPEEMTFRRVFTPKQEIVNHYNQMYGSGIVIAPAITLS